ESGTPLIVFNMNERGNVLRILRGEPVGTLVHWESGTEPVMAREASPTPAT
ncbi:MAG: hypothetical protein IIB09_09400, partial [Bacteroidetes bacterium]|nr:hypothetical protein [Bacteroidota bacterium]